MLTLAIATLLSTSVQAPVQAAPAAPQLVLLSLVDAAVAPAAGSLRARIEAARLRAAPPPIALPSLREQRALRALRPEPKDGIGSVSRRAVLGLSGYTSASDLRLGSSGRRAALSRAPQFRRRAR